MMPKIIVITDSDAVNNAVVATKSSQNVEFVVPGGTKRYVML